jgi:membrane associated rhomboid family serine protease/ribosomal protein L40E
LSSREEKRDQYIGRPSVCRHCGALVGSGESSCTQCGTPLATAATRTQTQRRPVYDSATISFARSILSRPAPFTFIFLIANVFLFLLVTFSGGAEDPRTLIAYGAKLNSLIDSGQWWRFVAPIFLHTGPLHLLFNMYGLWAIGPYVERLYGSSKFVVIWVVTGIAGVLASYLSVRPAMHVSSIGRFFFKATDVPSVGASGALFGLVGVLFVFGIKFRRELPDGFKRAFGTGMLPIIAINLVIGFLGRGFIDNAAHMGGLAAGALLALVVDYKRSSERSALATMWHVLQGAAIALVLIGFFMVWRNFDGPAPSLSGASLQRGLTGSGRAATAHIEIINEGTEAFRSAFSEGDTRQIDPVIAKIDNAPSLDKEPDAFRAELRSLLIRARDTAVIPEKGKPPQTSPQRDQLRADFQTWHDRNVNWVKTEGQKYGLVIKNSSENPSK